MQRSVLFKILLNSKALSRPGLLEKPCSFTKTTKATLHMESVKCEVSRKWYCDVDVLKSKKKIRFVFAFDVYYSGEMC